MKFKLNKWIILAIIVWRTVCFGGKATWKEQAYQHPILDGMVYG